MTDLFLYWNIPEYANIYANEALLVEHKMKSKNPMVSAQTYLKQKEYKKADVMLDSLYVLLNDTHSPNLLHLDYRPVLDHYIQKNNKEKVQQYVQLMYQEQQAFKEQKLKQSNDEKTGFLKR